MPHPGPLVRSGRQLRPVIGIYIRALRESIHGTPAEAAKKAADHGLTVAPILACWQTAKGTAYSNGRDGARILRYAEAFAKTGIEPWIWGYPWAPRIQVYEARITSLIRAGAGLIRGHLADPELGLKWQDGRAWVQCQRAALEINRGSIAITSYGMAAGHRNFPWEALAKIRPPKLPMIGSPQFYKTPPKDVRRGLQAWHEYGFHPLIPSVPAYGPYSRGALDGYIENLAPYSAGFLVWSWRQMNADEWKTVAKWALRFRSSPAFTG